MSDALSGLNAKHAHAGGATPGRVRNHNERLILSLIQSHGAMASADIARGANLSAQTASVITRALEAEGLLRKGKPVRGKVGKPLTPMALNPDGVLSVGLRIGRRSADLILLDLTGAIRAQQNATFPFPTPEGICRFVKKGLDAFGKSLSPGLHERVVGLGVAAPYQLWNWLDIVNAPTDEMSAWRDFDFADAFAAFTDLPVTVGNDGALACFGEHMFGAGRGSSDFAYFHIGAFAGGGMVLGGRLHVGPRANAGAFGSIPVRDTDKPRHQLLHNASVFVLEQMLADAGRDPAILRRNLGEWSGFEEILADWIATTSKHLATACVAVAAVLDIPVIVIDGNFPPDVRERLTREVEARLRDVDMRGIVPPAIRTGELGRISGALGAGFEPIQSAYLIAGSALR